MVSFYSSQELPSNDGFCLALKTAPTQIPVPNPHLWTQRAQANSVNSV